MADFFQNQGNITKTTSIYMILMFLCLPIWNMVSNTYDLVSDNAIELEEVLEFEVEDNSEKEISDNQQYNNSIQHSIKKNETRQATILHAFKYLSTLSDVLTPPPKFI